MKSLYKTVTVFILLAGILTAISGCEPDIPKPDPLLNEELYSNVLAEMMIIRTLQAANPDSVNVDSLKEVVYNYYEVPETHFMQSHKYYEQFVKDHEARVNRIIDSLQVEQEQIETIKVQPDTASAP